MSWTLGTTSTKPEEVREKLEQNKDNQLAAATFDSWDDGVQDQMNIAMDCVNEILGAPGFGEKLVNVSMNGHLAQVGQGNSSVSISVYEV